jgi:hypothetical protein
LHEDHRLLLSSFGGIDRDTSDVPSVLNNLNGALAVEHLSPGFGGQEQRFQKFCYGHDPNLDPRDFVTFATEANGNSFVYRLRDSWTAYLSWDMVGPCWGSEEQAEIGCGMLYLVEGVTTFREWVELLAKQHLPMMK